MSILNVLNILLPLITLPYLIKTIGLANYGTYSVICTILQYALLFSQYGFAYSTTQLVAKNRENLEQLNIIFNATIWARLILSVLAIVICFCIILIYHKSDYTIMYILGIGMIIGDVINPIWLFQGMEKMKYLTIVNVVCKVIFTILIFVFINDIDDYIHLPLLNSFGFLFSGILSLIIACKVFRIKLFLPKFSDILIQLRSGWLVFISTIFMQMYRNSNVFILSFFVNDIEIGMYSGAEKMVKAAQSIASPISNAFYPYFANKYSNNSIDLKLSLYKLSKVMLSVLLLIVILYFIGADLLNELFLDSNTRYTAYLMRIMTPVILFGGLNYILGFVGLFNLGKQKEFTKYVMFSGMLSLLFLLVFVQFYGVSAAAWAMNISEIILFIFLMLCT